MKLTVTALIFALVIALIPQCQKHQDEQECKQLRPMRYDSMIRVAQGLMYDTDSLICATDSLRCVLEKKHTPALTPTPVLVLPTDRPYQHFNQHSLKK